MDNLADSELVLSSPTSTRKNAVILAAAIAQNHASLETGSELKHEERTGICSALGLDPKTESGKEDPVWYLAYGSNLNPKVFEGRRGIKPLEKRNVLVPGLELTFDLAGFPYIEPRFANTRLCKDTDTTVETFVNDGAVGHVSDEKSGVLLRTVHANDFKPDSEGFIHLKGPWSGKGALIGVAYLVTPTDFAQILATEGGGSTYEMVAIDAYELSQDCENPCGEENGIKLKTQGDTFKVFTLLAPEEKTRKSKGYSSQRYLTLIRDGAKVNNLPKVYLDYLYTLKPYSIVNFRQKVGRALLLAFWAPGLLAVLMLTRPFTDKDGRGPSWLSQLKEKLFKSMWSAYDSVWKVQFGDGETSTA